jgi:predicted RNase H-like HicB family nuclease
VIAQERQENMRRLLLTVAIEKEKLSTGEDVYVALCLELDIASQGFSIEEAKANLREAVELFLESASPSELDRRLPNREESSEVFTTQLDISVRSKEFETTPSLVRA